MKSSDSNVALRILLADDHEIIRLGTAAFLRQQLVCEICAEAADGRQALQLAASTRPDVAVIDLGLPGLNGLEVTLQMRRVSPATEVVVLSGDASGEMSRRALEAGARAFINKAEAVTHLVEAVRLAGVHRFYLTAETPACMRAPEPAGQTRGKKAALPALTEREREVVQSVAEGKSNKQVALMLGLSVKTVETHRAAIMRKLKFRGLSDLVLYAIKSKIIRA